LSSYARLSKHHTWPSAGRRAREHHGLHLTLPLTYILTLTSTWRRQVDKPVDLKRARLEKDVLEGMLFRLFERQSTWNFNQLQKETDQPAMWLKVRYSLGLTSSHPSSASPACRLTPDIGIVCCCCVRCAPCQRKMYILTAGCCVHRRC